VLDVGWYRTTIRSFEREIYNIPNSVFSRNVVLNITRKQREWRFFEFIGALPMMSSAAHEVGPLFHTDEAPPDCCPAWCDRRCGILRT